MRDQDQTEAGQTELRQAENATARVRRVLIDPLAGLARPRGVTDASHREALARLARKLAYMDDAPLAGLAELCLGHAGQVALSKTARPACPLDGMILAWAYALQAPPLQVSDYPASVVRSQMGRRAHDAGYGVELLRHARRFGPPPGAYSITRMQDEARENARRRAALRQEIEAGNSLDAAHAKWLAAWHSDADLVARLIVEGDARREAKYEAQNGEQGQAA